MSSRPHLAAALVLAVFAVAPGMIASTASAEPIDLDRALDLALANNERLKAASFETEAARARIAASRSAFLPEVTVTGTTLRRGLASARNVGGVVTSTRESTFGALDVAQPLWDARVGPLVRQARLQLEQAELERDDERRRLLREVSDAYLVALSAEQVVEAASRRLDLARAGGEDVRARVEAGLVSSNDATKVQLEEASAARDLARAQLTAGQARIDLGFLVGTTVDAPLAPPAWLLADADEPVPAMSGLVLRARTGRPDVAALQRLAQSLRELAREPARRAVPRFDLAAGADFRDDDGIGGFEDWTVALDFTWDVFDGGLRAAQRRERLALADAASQQADLLARSAVSDVAHSLAELETARANVVQAEAAAHLARMNADQTSELYRQGLRPALEIATAGVQLFEAEVDLVRERYGLALAHVDLLAAIGEDPREGLGP